MRNKEKNLIMKGHQFLTREVKLEEIGCIQFRLLITNKKIKEKTCLPRPFSKKEIKCMGRKLSKEIKKQVIRMKDSAIKTKSHL